MDTTAAHPPKDLAISKDLPVAQVYEREDGCVVVKWGEGGARQMVAALSDDYTDSFHVVDENGDEPDIKKYGCLPGCSGGTLKIGEKKYLIRRVETLVATGSKRSLAEADQEDNYKTPRHPKARREAPSPGTKFETLDTTKSDYLKQVMNICLENVDIAVPESALKEPKLEEFTREKMFHTAGSIDGRFRKIPTFAGKMLTEFLGDEEKRRMNAILLGKSGVGKTTAIFDAARRMYCIFFSASENSFETTRHDPGQVDENFSSMVERIEIDLRSGIEEEEQNKNDRCNHIIRSLLVARMLILYHFQTLEGATPEKWMQYQLKLDLHEKTWSVFEILQKPSKQRIKNVFSLLKLLSKRLGRNWFFALDEAQLGLEILAGEGPPEWNSKSNKAKKRGVGSAFLKILAGIGPTTIAGTALSLDVVGSVKSVCGKIRQAKLFTEFPPVSAEEIYLELEQNLNLEKVDLDAIPLWKLEGRGRLLGNLIPKLEQSIKLYPGQKKQNMLHNVVDGHYGEMLENTKQQIRAAFPAQKDKVAIKPSAPASLVTLALAALWGGTIGVGQENIDLDLLDIGVCSVRVRGNDDEEKSFILDEDLAKQAILEVALEYDFSSHAFKNIIDMAKAAKSHAAEPLLISELVRWSRSKPEATVHGFLENLFGEKLPVLPQWTKTAKFDVRNAEKHQKDIIFIKKAIDEDRDLRGSMLSPSTVKRPDFEGVMGKGDSSNISEDESSPWFFAISSKLYKIPFHDKFDFDLNSTSPREGFYRKKDGTPNPNCKKLREEWQVLLEDKNHIFRRCLRVHCCLPDVKFDGPDVEERRNRIWVAADESIVAYITKENVRNIFSEDAMKILEHLKVVALEAVNEEA